ncbi:MAG TPA: BatD family protein [Thermoanaerobaculia bacterium]
MSVDRRSISVLESVTITVSLEGDFAAVDSVDIPLQNLILSDGPSTSSEYSWINGTVIRCKVFRYRARALGPGPALVGPLVLRTDEGKRDTLAPVALQVLPDRASGSNDPEVVLRELLATDRDPLFVVASADKTDVYVGERVLVTWYLYNAANVQQWQIASVPKLPDFWTDELEGRDRDPEQVILGGMLVQRLPVRRVALYPLRSGSHQVGGMTIEAAIMRRSRRSGPFDRFEGAMAEVEFTSAPLTIHAKPIPAGAPVDAVGELALTCGEASQQAGGPVVMDVSLLGRGNVRAAAKPHFAGTVDGTVQVEEGRVNVTSDERDAVTTTRRWRYIIFPRSRGMLELPALVSRIFDPVTGERRELRCAARSLFVNESTLPAPTPAASAPEGRRTLRTWLPVLLGVVAAIALLTIAARVWRRQRALRDTARSLVDDESPVATRERVDAWLALQSIDPGELLREQTERGDAYRSLRSLLQALERERFAVGEREVERRVRDLVATIARR